MSGGSRPSTRALALSPHGLLHLEDAADADAGAALPPQIADRIARAFADDPGGGLLHLGAVEVDTVLPPTLAYFRDLARDLVAALRAEPDLEELRDRVDLTPPRERLEELAASAPPMRGGEYVTVDVL